MTARAVDTERGDMLLVTTERMAYGPHAVARAAGKVLFVRGAAPGEELEVVITEERRSYAYADTLKVVRPSADRRVPPCPYLPDCGGCPWQHLDYAAQLAAKREIVADHLRRIGGLGAAVSPVIPSPHEYGYRRRLKLRVEGGEVGFYAAASHWLVPVEHCLLAEPEVDRAIPAARDLARRLATRVRRVGIVGSAGDDSRVAIVAEAEGRWQPDDEERCLDWLADHPAVRGLSLNGRSWQRGWGDPRVTVEPEPGLLLSASARSFTQVNPEANQALVAAVVGLAEPAPGLRVLELHAGAGNFSIPLARRGARVLAVEADRGAAEDARRNGAALLDSPHTVRSGRAERVVGQLIREKARFDVVLLDPPRSGAAELVGRILELEPPAIVYVSCDPATLARDLRTLAGRYRVDAVQPIDMFPHGYHVETVVRLRLPNP